MPIHDWTRVEAGIFHHLHSCWIVEISKALNAGILPPDYYALAEQVAGVIPDVLTLQAPPRPRNGQTEPPAPPAWDGPAGIALATVPPRVRFTDTVEVNFPVRKRKSVVIRHISRHRVIALIEILSPGNKASRHAIQALVKKALTMIRTGVHLLLLDLHPPGPRDPQGIHRLVWDKFKDNDFTLPTGKPLTLAAYAAGDVKRAFVETVAVGDMLPDMPLFLDPETYVNVPLEATYRSAWEAVPLLWRRELES